VCASRAKSQYKLSEQDLGRLICALVRNPHYSSQAPMRLYNLAEVVEASLLLLSGG
jgi:hypothetical protein